jgi:hypothetical protein
MSLNEMYSKVRTGKILFDNLPNEIGMNQTNGL